MDGVRLEQAGDLRAALGRIGPADVPTLSAGTDLAAFTVRCRLAERPDWFRCVGGDWRALVG